MSKKRISGKKVTDIASIRMNKLMNMASESMRNGNNERAKRYVTLTRRISMRTKTAVPEGCAFCKKCSLPLVPGINCRVRLCAHKINMHCAECNTIKRIPYLKEQKG